VGSADPRAGQHRDGDLGDHRQIDADHVAGLDAAVLEHVGKSLGVAQEVGVGDLALLTLFAAPVESDAVAASRLDVAVEAVVGSVELPVGEPLVERRVGIVEHLLGFREPVEVLAGKLGPPRLRVGRGLLVGGLVRDQSRGAKVLRRVEMVDVEQGRELLLEPLKLGLCCHLLLLNRRGGGQPYVPRAMRPAPSGRFRPLGSRSPVITSAGVPAVRPGRRSCS
jgi:hypothetical protein